MNNKIILIVAVMVLIFMLGVVLIGGTIYYLYYNGYFTGASLISDPANISYNIDGRTLTLKDGAAEAEYPPMEGDKFAEKIQLSLFGEPVYGDLDADGDNDAAVWLSVYGGGTGVFYYAALAVNEGTGYRSTNMLLLGDRIAPQTLEVRDGRAIYNFAERRTGEPMAAQPSVGRSFYIKYDKTTGQISEDTGANTRI